MKKIGENQHSLELQVLIDCLKVVLLDASPVLLENALNKQKLDWQRFEKLLVYHKVRPIVYTAFKQIGLQHPIMERLEKIQKNQALRDLVSTHQVYEIARVFRENNLEIMPYKGMVFKEKLFENQTLRERNDIDLIVLPENAVPALQLLFSMGYSLVYNKKTDAASLAFLIDNLASSEISLTRREMPHQATIDFHWGVHEFPPFGDYTRSLFEQIHREGDIRMPNPMGIFSMLLNHHGGREFWVRLKHLADLIQFLKKFPEISIEQLQAQATVLKMHNVFNYGMRLIEDNLGYPAKTTKAVGDNLLSSIYTMWEVGRHWDQLIPKARMFYIKRNILDKQVSWLKMGYYEFLVQTGYDLRIPTSFWFKKLRIVNFLSKFIFWLKHKVVKGNKSE